jgi:phospholipase/lecithinase/hemolysin
MTSRASTSWKIQGIFRTALSNQVLATGFFLLTFLSPIKTLAASFSGLYIFGDSLSDTGNFYNLTQQLNTINPQIPIIPPSPPYSNGRFSNGPLWVENLATQLGLTFDPRTNFALGGATTGSTNTILPGIPGLNLPGLQQQIETFTGATETADANGLYIVWAGANDYLGGGQTNPAVPVGNLATAIAALAGVGAKNILVANLPNLGTLPLTRDNPQAGGLNALTAAHNIGLAQTLAGLKQQLNASVNLIPLDINLLFNQTTNNPQQFGFKNVKMACLTANGVCANPDEFLFWDTLHSTAAGHREIARFAYSVLNPKTPQEKPPQSVPEPSGVAGVLAFGVLGTILLRRRRAIG